MHPELRPEVRGEAGGRGQSAAFSRPRPRPPLAQGEPPPKGRAHEQGADAAAAGVGGGGDGRTREYGADTDRRPPRAQGGRPSPRGLCGSRPPAARADVQSAMMASRPPISPAYGGEGVRQKNPRNTLRGDVGRISGRPHDNYEWTCSKLWWIDG